VTLRLDICRCHNIECHLHATCARWIDRDHYEVGHTPHDLFAPEGDECSERIPPTGAMRTSD